MSNYWVVTIFGDSSGTNVNAPDLTLYEDPEEAMEKYERMRLRYLMPKIEEEILLIYEDQHQDETNRRSVYREENDSDRRVIAGTSAFKRPEGLMISKIVPDKLSLSGDYWVVTQFSSQYNPAAIGDHDHDPENPVIELFSTKAKAKQRYTVLKQSLNSPDTYASEYPYGDGYKSTKEPHDEYMDIDLKGVAYSKIQLTAFASLSQIVKGALN